MHPPNVRFPVPALVVWLAIAGCGKSDSQKKPDLITIDGGSVVDATSAADAEPVSTCPSGACDLITNEGCTGSSGCRYLSLDGVTVNPMCESAGRRGEGHGCLTYDQCEPGLFCSPVTNACLRYCCGSDAPCGGITYCVEWFPGGVGLCEPNSNCDVITDEGCSGDSRCLLVRGDGVAMCLSSDGTKEEGQSCESLDCAPGHQCMDGVCVLFCDTEHPTQCVLGDRCVKDKFALRPKLGTCVDIENPCANAIDEGECTNEADCAIYDNDEFGVGVTAAGCLELDENVSECIQDKTGLSPACSDCFADLKNGNSFSNCAGF